MFFTLNQVIRQFNNAIKNAYVISVKKVSTLFEDVADNNSVELIS